MWKRVPLPNHYTIHLQIDHVTLSPGTNRRNWVFQVAVAVHAYENDRLKVLYWFTLYNSPRKEISIYFVKWLKLSLRGKNGLSIVETIEHCGIKKCKYFFFFSHRWNWSSTVTINDLSQNPTRQKKNYFGENLNFRREYFKINTWYNLSKSINTTISSQKPNKNLYKTKTKTHEDSD